MAQLVARFVRIEEVRGSIPLSSTPESPALGGAFVVRGAIRWRVHAEPGRLCGMDHRMSDDELRRAIRVLRERADLARSEGRHDDVEMIERTVRDYQEEMAQRL